MKDGYDKIALSNGGKTMQNRQNKDWLPLAAIAAFLVILIVLCIVRLQARDGKNDSTESTESVEEIQAGEWTSETETVIETETEIFEETEESKEETQMSEKEVHKEAVAEENKSDSAGTGGYQAQLADDTNAEGDIITVNGVDVYSGAAEVHKTNEEMLGELQGYWSRDNMKAVEEMVQLAWYRKMSASLTDSNTFYYFGERNAQGKPEGIGTAVYAGNEYYYGQWKNGVREGEGEWIKKYIYYDTDTTSDRAYSLHLYMGEWKNDLPNGAGQEHYDLNIHKASQEERYVQNVIGTFQDGYYSGEMYLTTLNYDGNQEEWNGIAEEGIWTPYGAGNNKKEVPICVDVADDENYLWLAVKENKDRGISELIE